MKLEAKNYVIEIDSKTEGLHIQYFEGYDVIADIKLSLEDLFLLDTLLEDFSVKDIERAVCP